jgi:hypothetical protein
MAITPQEALGNKHEKEKQAIEELDKKWQSLLSANYDGRRAVTISSQTGYNQFVVDTVLARYREKGWDIELDGEQRDGYYYTFKPKSSSSYYDK